MYRQVVFVIILVVSTFVGMTANAAIDCDDFASGDTCDANGNLGGDVCIYDGTASKYKCITYFSSSDDLIRAVTDTNSHAVMWGTAQGYDFCCDYTDFGTTNLYPIVIDTASGDDEIRLNSYPTSGYYWRETSAVDAGTGDDYVAGSDYETSCGDTSTWCDDIDANYGWDEVHGLGGGDRIRAPQDDGAGNTFHGDRGKDKVIGGGYGDYLYGGDHDDVMYGGDQDDNIEGNDGDDWISGGAIADTLYGNAGANTVCGKGGTDTIDGGGGGDDTCAEIADTPLNCNTVVDTCPAAPF